MQILYKIQKNIQIIPRVAITPSKIVNAPINGMKKIQEMKRAPPLKIKTNIITIEHMIANSRISGSGFL